MYRTENSTKDDILWIQNDHILLNKTFNIFGLKLKEPKIAVDSENNVYLSNVTPHESGFYSCIVNGLPIIEYRVIIRKTPKIFTNDFFKHLVILTIIIFIYWLLYCVIVTIKIHKVSEYNERYDGVDKERERLI